MNALRVGFRRGLLGLFAGGLLLFAMWESHAQMGPRGVQIGQLYVELDAGGAQDKYDQCMEVSRAPLICQQMRSAHEHHDPVAGVEARLVQAMLAVRSRAKSGEFPDVAEFDRILAAHGISVFDIVEFPADDHPAPGSGH